MLNFLTITCSMRVVGSTFHFACSHPPQSCYFGLQMTAPRVLRSIPDIVSALFLEVGYLLTVQGMVSGEHLGRW